MRPHTHSKSELFAIMSILMALLHGLLLAWLVLRLILLLNPDIIMML
jgi:hypothetical protein